MCQISETAHCEEKNSPIPYTEGQYNISNSILCNFTMRAIFIYTNDINSSLFIECCTFSYDSSYGKGGAIYYGNYGEIVFSKVNGMHCMCKNDDGEKNFGHFSFTASRNSSSMNYTSLSACSSEMKGKYACYFDSGIQEMSYTNISNCNGIFAGFIYGKSNPKSFVQSSNFNNQTAYWYSYIYKDFEFDLKIVKCNYVGNSVTNLIGSFNAGVIIENCNILSNKVDVLFFTVDNGKITVIKCCLYNSNSFSVLTSGFSINFICPYKSQKFQNLYKSRFRRR